MLEPNAKVILILANPLCNAVTNRQIRSSLGSQRLNVKAIADHRRINRGHVFYRAGEHIFIGLQEIGEQLFLLIGQF